MNNAKRLMMQTSLDDFGEPSFVETKRLSLKEESCLCNSFRNRWFTILSSYKNISGKGR